MARNYRLTQCVNKKARRTAPKEERLTQSVTIQAHGAKSSRCRASNETIDSLGSWNERGKGKETHRKRRSLFATYLRKR